MQDSTFKLYTTLEGHFAIILLRLSELLIKVN